MDSSDKAFSSSTPINNKPSQTLINDENEKIREEMDPILRYQKTPAALRKKKILAENNQTNTSKLETSQESLSQKTSSQTQVAEFDENEQKSALAPDSDSMPYDPVTNYLSPRPKFLRYQPSRRREILLRKKNEGSSIISTSSFFEFKNDIGEEGALIDALEGPIGNLKLEDEGFDDESDDEFEEIDEVRRWGLTGLLKFFLVIAALVFCTSCVSTMNSNSPSFPAQAVRSLEDKYYLIQHNVYEFVKSFQDSRQLLNGENSVDLSGIAESRSEILRILKAEKNRQVDELDEVIELLQRREIEAIESQSEGLKILEAEKNGQVDELDEVVELIQSGEIEAIDADVGENKGEAVEQLEEEMDQVFDNTMAKSEETCDQMATEKFESLQDSQVTIIPDWIPNKEVVAEQIEAVNSVETDHDDGNQEIEPIQVVNSLDTEQIEAVNSVLETDHDDDGNQQIEPIQLVNGVDADQADDEIDRTNIVNPEPVPSLIELTGSELYLKAVIAASIFCTILASLVSELCFMKKKRVHNDSSKEILKPCAKKSVTVIKEKKNILEDSPPVADPYAEPAINVPVIKPSSISTLPHDEDKENCNGSDYFAKSQLLIEEEASSESYKSHVPAVEFLGEFAIGEVSSSMRSRMIKHKTIESEVSSHSVSAEKAQSISYHSQQPALSESSNIVSPSHGSFAAEKKTSKKKKENRDGDSAGITTTPLRRSNRLQSRAVASPVSMKASSSNRL